MHLSHEKLKQQERKCLTDIPTDYDDEAILQPKVPSSHVTLASVKLTQKKKKKKTADRDVLA